MADIATVTSKGQVTLPSRLRRKYGIRKGTRLVFLEAAGELRVIKEQDLDRMFSVFDRIRKGTKVTRKELDTLVERVRARLWSERYAGRP